MATIKTTIYLPPKLLRWIKNDKPDHVRLSTHIVGLLYELQSKLESKRQRRDRQDG